MEIMGVEKGLRYEGKTSTKRQLIGINATPESDSPLWKPTFQQFLPRNKATHHLLRVKPHMMKQVLSLREFCEEIKAASSGNAEVMELFPHRTGFATTKHTGTCLLPASPLLHHHLAVKSGHQLECRSLDKPPGIGVGGAQPTGAISASPATTHHKKSSTQLTIFYDGTMNVYDVSADQAQAIMNMLSGNGNAHELDPDPNFGERGACTTTSGSSTNPLFWTVQTTGGPDDVPTALTMPKQTATAEGTKELENLRKAVFPLARKQSLQRFLQNRQIRLNSVGPYTNSAASPTKAVDDKMGAPPTLNSAKLTLRSIINNLWFILLTRPQWPPLSNATISNKNTDSFPERRVTGETHCNVSASL